MGPFQFASQRIDFIEKSGSEAVGGWKKIGYKKGRNSPIKHAPVWLSAIKAIVYFEGLKIGATDQIALDVIR
jgi:hypothetical protein